MAEPAALRKLRNERFFDGWDEFLGAEQVQASETSVRQLIDDLLALGTNPTEEAARRAVRECVRRFNELDQRDRHWICTDEREDIYEQIGRVVEACGFVYDDDWLDERDW